MCQRFSPNITVVNNKCGDTFVKGVFLLQGKPVRCCQTFQPVALKVYAFVCFLQVYEEDCCDPCFLELQNHLPKYYGTWSPPDSPNGKRMSFLQWCTSTAASQQQGCSCGFFLCRGCISFSCLCRICPGTSSIIFIMHFLIESHKY